MPSSSAPHEFTGRHALAELSGIDPAMLNRASLLMRVLRGSCEQHGARPLSCIPHTFTPQGVSIILLLEESHASMHTYPEHGRAFIDVFTCGRAIEPSRIVASVAAWLGGRVEGMREVARGVP